MYKRHVVESKMKKKKFRNRWEKKDMGKFNSAPVLLTGLNVTYEKQHALAGQQPSVIGPPLETPDVTKQSSMSKHKAHVITRPYTSILG